MNVDLSGKIALVTGSTEGIGFAIAHALHNAGADVVVNGRTRQKVDAAIARLGARAGSCLRSRHRRRLSWPDRSRGRTRHRRKQPRDFSTERFFDTDDEIWDRHWQINVMAGMRLARAYLPRMAEKAWGRFVFLGSESAFNVPVEMIHYGISKTADVALARGLAKRMAGIGVTVNSVLPGPTFTEGAGEMLKDQITADGSFEQVGIDFVKTYRPTSIIQRPATVEEVANMVVYVASRQASATTGAAPRVDGGVVDFIV